MTPWEATPMLRWRRVITGAIPGTTDAHTATRILEQAWRNLDTGDIEWREVPLAED